MAGQGWKSHCGNVRHVPKLCGNAARQLVPLEPEKLQVGQAAQLRRYLPAQLVAVEVQKL